MSIGAFLRSHRWLFAAGLAAAMAHAGAAIVFASGLQLFFDAMVETRPGQREQPLAALVMAPLGLAAILATTAIQRRLIEGIGLAYVHGLRLRLFRHLLEARPLRSGASQRAGLILPFVGDLAALRLWVGDGIARLVLGGLVSLVLIIYIGTRHLPLAIALSAGLLSLAALAWVVRSPLDHTTRKLRRARGALSTFVAGRLEAAPTVTSMGRGATELRKLEKRSTRLTLTALRRAWLVGCLRGLAQAGGCALLLATVLITATSVRDATLSPGEVVGLLSLVGVMGQALQDLARSLELYVPGRVAAQRVSRLLDLPRRLERRGRRTLREPAGLSLRKLGLAGLEQPASLEAQAGDIILLDGPAGSGKSALLAALAGLESPLQGQVFLQGHNLAWLAATERARLVGLASTAVPLLPGTIGMNLRYRCPQASRDALARLSLAMELEDHGLAPQRMLRGSDALLSSGEQEILLIARALLNEPQLLLLDCVDGNLPPSVIEKLAGLIRSYPGIVVMASQRTALRQTATRTWRIGNGTLVEATDAVAGFATLPHPDTGKTP